MVLYTSQSCAFCQVTTHVFETLKRLIPSDLVEFVSIDASANDLPWSFTALAVPSVLYFNSSEETRAFPMSKGLSVPNLLSFIVANLDGQTRVKLALSICGDDCLDAHQQQKLAKKLDNSNYPDDILARIWASQTQAGKHDELWPLVLASIQNIPWSTIFCYLLVNKTKLYPKVTVISKQKIFFINTSFSYRIMIETRLSP